MHESLKEKLSEVIGTANVSYILNDNKELSVTGFKVMQNQRNAGLLRCAKIMYNGKIKFVYLVDKYKPLSVVVNRLGLRELTAVLFNLIQRAVDIKANGFFKPENLELDYNKIFVDTTDFSVHLVYFPVTRDPMEKASSFENEFRLALINLFNSFPVFNAPQFQRLCSDLANGPLSFDVLQNRLHDNNQMNQGFSNQDGRQGQQNFNQFNQKEYDQQGFSQRGFDQRGNDQYGFNQHGYDQRGNDQYGFNQHGYDQRGNDQYGFNQHGFDQQGVKPDNFVKPNDNQYSKNYNQNGGRNDSTIVFNNSPAPQPTMKLTAVNSPMSFSLMISESEFLIGKNPNMVNGAVTYNPAISRVHCKISYSDGKYYLTDLGSANGTFINQRRLSNNKPTVLNNGDTIQLANSNFIVAF